MYVKLVLVILWTVRTLQKLCKELKDFGGSGSDRAMLTVRLHRRQAFPPVPPCQKDTPERNRVF